MNIVLLRKIQKRILAEPRQFVMSQWFWSNSSVPNCGTAACIAGWAIVLKSGSPCATPAVAKKCCPLPMYQAREELRLNWLQSENLFYLENWPEDFVRDYRTASGQEQKAVVAAKRIDHFIKTKGAE